MPRSARKMASASTRMKAATIKLRRQAGPKKGVEETPFFFECLFLAVSRPWLFDTLTDWYRPIAAV
jgi:hypothetical protein